MSLDNPNAKPQAWKWLCLLGFVHMMTEAVCSFWLTRVVEEMALAGTGVLCYNILAFWTQPVAGWLADRRRWAKLFVLLGGVLALSGGLFWEKLPWATAVCLGVGNSLVHVGTGGLCVGLSRGRAGGLGVLVGPGAAGLVLGIYFYDQGWAGMPWVLAGLLVVALVLSWPIKVSVTNAEPVDASLSWPKLVLAAALVLLCIALRSALGSGFGFGWKGGPHAALAIGLAMAAGKITGGFVADRVGWMATAMAVILGSIPFLWFGKVHELPGLVGLMLFQMPMAVTLGLLVRLLPGRPAFAFGLASAVVYGGAFLVTGHAAALLQNFALLTALSVGVVALLWCVIRIAPAIGARR